MDAHAIRSAREAAQLSEEELAAACGVQVQTVRRWEADDSSPQPQQVPKLAEALGLSVEELIGVPLEQMSVLQARYRLGWTTQEAAAQAGVSVFTWNRIERGRGASLPARRDPQKVPALVRVAEVLGLPVDQIARNS